MVAGEVLDWERTAGSCHAPNVESPSAMEKKNNVFVLSNTGSPGVKLGFRL